MIAGKKYIGT
jgi:5'-AMP-activated protein kinase catalytic alpha subunit